jgi:hypothetical protein
MVGDDLEFSLLSVSEASWLQYLWLLFTDR